MKRIVLALFVLGVISPSLALAQEVVPGAFNGGVITGSYGQSLSTTWSGSTFPSSGNLGIYSTQTHTGTTTGSFGESGGNGLPLNMINMSDQVNFAGSGGVLGLLVRQTFGGGSASGGRNGLVVDFAQTGVMANANTNYAAVQIYSQGLANVTGAAIGSGNGLGADFGLGVAFGNIPNGVWRHEQEGVEIDWRGLASGTNNGSADYVAFMKLVNIGTAFSANVFTSYINFSTASPGTTGLFPHVLVFGDAQSTDGKGFPATSSGDLLYSFAGTVGTAINFANLTATELMTGPNSFAIDGSNHVHTDVLQGATGLTIGINDNNGNPIANFASVASSAAYLQFQSSATPAFGPILQAIGTSGASVPLTLQTGGSAFTGPINFRNGNNVTLAQIAGVAAPISYPIFTASTSGNPVLLDVAGTATSIALGLNTATAVQIGNGSAITNINGILEGTYNASGTIPASGSAWAMGWNYSNGSAEIDEWNLFNSAARSFSWFQKTGASTQSEVFRVTTASVTTFNDLISGSGANLSALNVTAGFFHFPFTNGTSGSGGVPTGTPATVNGDACVWNDVTFVLDCYSASAAAWKHVAFSASAG